MKLTTKQIAIIIAGVVIVGTLVVLIVFRPGASPSPPAYKLVVWGIDDRTAFEAGLAKYRAQYPQIEVAYKKIDAENYRAELLNALAAGTGPDVFMIHNRALPKQALTLMPASAEQMNVGRFRELFPTVAEQDFIAGPSVYALPLYLDTLSLLYNRDLFDRAGIVAPPATFSSSSCSSRGQRCSTANMPLRLSLRRKDSPRSIFTCSSRTTPLRFIHGTRIRNTTLTHSRQGKWRWCSATAQTSPR